MNRPRTLLGVRKSIGIECVMSRHHIAEQALQEMKVDLLLNPTLAPDTSTLGMTPAGSVVCAAAGTGCETPFAPYGAVTLHFGDATIGNSLQATHVYAFDRVFSPTTMKALARLLQVCALPPTSHVHAHAPAHVLTLLLPLLVCGHCVQMLCMYL